jgi:hypothetical protein
VCDTHISPNKIDEKLNLLCEYIINDIDEVINVFEIDGESNSFLKIATESTGNGIEVTVKAKKMALAKIFWVLSGLVRDRENQPGCS